MKDNRKLMMTSIGIAIITILAVSLISIFINYKFRGSSDKIFDNDINNNEQVINIYYLNKSDNQLVSEERLININQDKFLQNIFSSMKGVPKNSNLSVVVPENLEILDFELTKDDILNVNFSSEYYIMSEIEEIFFRSSFVWSVLDCNFVKGIKIYVENEPIKKGNGEEMDILNKDNVVLNPIISPDKIQTENVILYFSDENLLGLVPEKREIEVKQNQTIETQVVEQLILGPKTEGLINTIPSETKVRNIKTESGICYVDLNSEFITKNTGGSSEEVFIIYSIVNSLTELEEVNKVQFLIDGEKVNIYKGHLDISKPLDRDEDLILK